MPKSIVALITPFINNEINYDELKRLLDFHLENKTDSLLLLGTTQESESLNDEEKVSLVKFVYDIVYPKISIFVGIISNITEDTVRLGNLFNEYDIEGFLVINPYYNKTNSSGLIKHFTYIADHLKKPIIIYNVPKRTGMNIDFEVVKYLSYHNNIIGIKEAGADLSYLLKISTLINDNFKLYCGNDEFMLIGLFLGAEGLINVIGNAFPKEIKLICDSFNKNLDISKFTYYKLLSLISIMYDEVSPIGIKYIMYLLGFNTLSYRRPLDIPSKEFKRKLEEELLSIVE